MTLAPFLWIFAVDGEVKTCRWHPNQHWHCVKVLRCESKSDLLCQHISSPLILSSHSCFYVFMSGDIFLSRFSCVSSQHIMLQICDVGVVLRIGWNENSRVGIRVHTVDFPLCEDRGEEVWGCTDWKAEVREVAMNQSSRTFTFLQHYQKTVGEESNYNSI